MIINKHAVILFAIKRSSSFFLTTFRYKAGMFRMFFALVLMTHLLSPRAFAVTVDRVLAVVNNEVITQSEYMRFLKRTGLEGSGSDVEEKLLRKLIEEKIILSAAAKEGITAHEIEVQRALDDFMAMNSLTLEELERRLKEEGVSLGEYRLLLKENIITLKYTDREVNSKLVVTDKELEDYYQKNLNRFLRTKEKRLVKAIILRLSATPSPTEITDTKMKSLRIYADLKNGDSFEKMVALYADEQLKRQEGIFGEFEPGSLVPVLDLRLSAMKVGEFSEPLWTREAVYILKLIKYIPPVYIPYSEVKQTIFESVYEQKLDSAFNAWMENLWSQSSVRIIR